MRFGILDGETINASFWDLDYMASSYQKIPWPISEPLPELGARLNAGILGEAIVVETYSDWLRKPFRENFICCHFVPRETNARVVMKAQIVTKKLGDTVMLLE
jgi:hypothetical protein